MVIFLVTMSFIILVEPKNTCKLPKYMFCLEAAEPSPQYEKVHVLGSIAVLVGTISICQNILAAA